MEKRGKKALLLEKEVKVPRVTVRLVTSLRLLSRTSAIVPVQVKNYEQMHQGTVLFQENSRMLEHTGVVNASGIMQPDSRGIAYVVVENHSGYTESLEESTEIGTVGKADIVTPQDTLPIQAATTVHRIRTEEENEHRKAKLKESLGIERSDLPPEHRTQLLEMLASFHDAFSLAEEERGETDWVQFEIDTGEARPKRFPLRQMPFSVREELSHLVSNMQETGVICTVKEPLVKP